MNEKALTCRSFLVSVLQKMDGLFTEGFLKLRSMCHLRHLRNWVVSASDLHHVHNWLQVFPSRNTQLERDFNNFVIFFICC